MLLTKVLQVLLMPAVALLHSDEYGPRHLSELAVGGVALYVDISAPLAYYRSHTRDYNARHVLGSVPPGLSLAGYWQVTLRDGTDSGGGVVRLWASGRGEYVTRYTTWPVSWYVAGRRVLVLRYETLTITEFYAPAPLPEWASPGSLVLRRGRTRLCSVLHDLYED